MKIFLTFKCLWDKASGESINDYREKMKKFRTHVCAMQARGSLPVGEVYWVTGAVNGPKDTDELDPDKRTAVVYRMFKDSPDGLVPCHVGGEPIE